MATFATTWRAVQARLAHARDVAPREGWELAVAAAGFEQEERWVLEGKEFPAESEKLLAEYEERRLAGEPLAQVLGYAWFYSRKWTVTPDVLIPRPDTEILVEATLKLMGHDFKVVEVGIGTGCVMGTLLVERDDVTVLGIDISPAAAEVARSNLAGLRVEGRYEVLVNDGLEGVERSFNLIVSNPPYVTDEEWENLETEVKDFEPRLALTGGVANADGLVFYRRLAEWGRTKLLQGGWLCVEVGWQQAQAVRELLQQEGDLWHEISVLQDLGGRERVVCARRR